MNVKSFLKYGDCDEVKLSLFNYMDGRIAIRATDPVTYESVATLTVNVPELPIGKDEVLIKDYSENEGALKTLVEAGLVKYVADVQVSPFASVALCKLTVGA